LRKQFEGHAIRKNFNYKALYALARFGWTVVAKVQHDDSGLLTRLELQDREILLVAAGFTSAMMPGGPSTGWATWHRVGVGVVF